MTKKIIFVLIVLLFFIGCSGKTKEELLAEGIKYMEENNPNGAIVLFKIALESDENLYAARLQLAKAYVVVGKYDRAEREFLKVLRQTPSHTGIHLDIARIHINTHKPEDAIKEAKIFLQGNPENAEVLEILGHAYSLKGDLKEAEEYLLKSLNIDNGRITSKLGIAGIYIVKGDNKSARVILNEIVNSDNKNTQAYYLLANIEMASGRKRDALNMYKKIIEINKSDANALFMMGILHIENKELKEANEIVDKLKVFPEMPEYRRLKGIVCFYEGKFNDAIIELQSSIKIKPQIGSYYFLGLSHFNTGEFEQALSQFHKALDLNPSFIKARLIVSIILLRQNRLDDSIQETKRVLKADEKNALAHNILGSAYMAKGMYEDAMKELNIAIEIDPGLVDAHLKKGLFTLVMGNVKEAETELNTAVQVAPELLNTRLVLFSYYTKQKKYDKALNVLKEGITGKKGDALLYNNIAVTLFAWQKVDEAFKYLQKAKDSNPDYLAPYYNLATYYMGKGEHEKALDEYAAVLKKDPKNTSAILKIALILELKGRDNEALTYYKNAKDTNNPAGFIALANYLLRKNEYDKAIGVLDEAIKSIPKNIDAMELKGRVYLLERRYKESIIIFEEIKAINPEKGLQLLITTYVAMQDYKSALKELEDRLKLNPDRIDLMAEVSRVYVLMKDTQRAIENAKKIISKRPDSANGYMVLSIIHESQGDLKTAIDTLKKGLEVDEKNLQVRMALGNLYAKGREYPHAIGIYNEIVQKNRNYYPAIFAQGVIYQVTGNIKEAVKKYQEILENSENHIPALNNLAFLYADGHGSNTEALKLALRAYSLAQADASIMDTLGYALIKNNRSDDASRILEKAVSLMPDNPTIRYHLAIAYKETGKNAEAREQIEKSVQQMKDFPELADAKKILKEIKGK
jgi:putative PEP-CTERM system TPR-repeat lipoprotein